MSIILFGIVLVSQAEAQLMESPANAEIPQQSVYLEIEENGFIYSLNYDALCQSIWGIRLGGSFYPFNLEPDEIHNLDNESYAFLGLVIG